MTTPTALDALKQYQHLHDMPLLHASILELWQEVRWLRDYVDKRTGCYMEEADVHHSAALNREAAIERLAAAKPAPAGETVKEYCLADNSPSGCYCSLEKGHSGEHVAYHAHDPNMKVFDRWPQEPQPAPEPPLTPEVAKIHRMSDCLRCGYPTRNSTCDECCPDGENHQYHHSTNSLTSIIPPTTLTPEAARRDYPVLWLEICQLALTESQTADLVALVLRHAGVRYGEWTTLGELRAGALFEDREGERYTKAKGADLCRLCDGALRTGYNPAEVREIIIDGDK